MLDMNKRVDKGNPSNKRGGRKKPSQMELDGLQQAPESVATILLDLTVGRTPFDYAKAAGNKEMADLLKARIGQTPLEHAEAAGNKEMADLLRPHTTSLKEKILSSFCPKKR